MRFNPGLQARLALAFGAVAVLAVAANVLAERTVRVVIERVWNAPHGKLAVAPAVVAAPVETRTEPVPEPPAEVRRTVHVEDFATAVEDFDRAVQSRIAAAEPAVQRQLDSSTAALQRRLTQLRGELGNARRSQQRALLQDSENLRAQAGAAIVRADERRTAFREYTRAIDAVAASARQKLEGSWRILGRVIARQQMVELRDRAEELRQSAARLADPQAIDEDVLSEVTRLEVALSSLVPAAPKRSTRAGDEPSWDEQLREQMNVMFAARERLSGVDRETQAADLQRASLLAQYRQRIDALPTSVPVTVAVAANAKPASAATVKAVPASSSADPVEEPVVASQPIVTERETIHGDDVARAERSRVLLVWISAAALLITLAVGVLTVRSLMRQIGRLLTGIRRVARGEAAAVGMGGLHEIDVVAAEFNAMSTQLAAARAENLAYQTDLEARVEQRTAQLHYQAAHDPLTSLPNRRELNRLLTQALATAERNDRRVGVFLIDLDNFKVVNDGMGHGFGDQVLIAVAERLQSLVPAGGFASRLGGDEFTMVAADAHDIDSIRAAGWALVRAFQQPLSISGRELLLSVSVGASIYPDHEADAEALLRAADSALFRAKALGRSQLALFTPEMFDAAEARFSTEQSLRRAVERGEFELVYQPEVDSRSFEIRSVEALLRWRLPDGRHASPGEFLSVAEESGLIAEISDWVLGEAVAAAGRWYRGGWREVRVAINVSSRQLVDLGFVPRLADLLAKEGLPPTAVEIELTENVLQTGAHTVKTLHSLRALGVSTALDDFGTGYSSLASLEQLPLTRVKLDRSLIEAMDTSPRAAAIARSIINLCEGLGLEVTAEGVERLAQFDLLMRHQPLMLQGFLLARPMAESTIDAARASMQSRLTSLLLSAQEEGTLQTARPSLPEVAEERRTGYL